jgi:hypothetical protein
MPRKVTLALLIIGWAALIRISVLQAWILPGVAALSFASSSAVCSILLPAAVSTLAAGLAIDRIGYGRWVFTGWNFVYWNQLRGLSAKFGTSLPYFYLKILSTRTLSSLLPFFAFGLWEALKRARSSKRPYLFPLTHLALPTLACLSSIAHKEPRFMTPIIPILLVYCAYGLQQAHSAVAKRSPWQRGFFWVTLSICIAWQLLCGHEQIRNRFCDHYELFSRMRNILDHDPHLDRSDRCNGGVMVMSLPYRFPGAGFLHRPVIFSSPSVHPEMVASLLPKDELRDEFTALAVSLRFEPLLINMQIRGQSLPAILVLPNSFLKSHGADTKVLEASGYRECGFLPVKHPLEHGLWNTSETLRHSLLDTKSVPEDLYIFCKRYSTSVLDNPS